MSRNNSYCSGLFYLLYLAGAGRFYCYVATAHCCFVIFNPISCGQRQNDGGFEVGVEWLVMVVTVGGRQVGHRDLR
jgi:hypothetical protein